MKIRFLIIPLILLTSCTQNQNDTELVLPEKKMIDVLFDVQLSETYIINNRTLKVDEVTSIPEEHYKYIFDKHQITKAQFEESIKFYQKDLPKFKTLYDSVARRLEALRDKK